MFNSFISSFKEQEKSDRIIILIDYFLKLIILSISIVALLVSDWLLLFITLLVLFFSFLPIFIEKRINSHLPVEFDLITTLFLFSSLILGDFLAFYTRFWWWDKVLHTLSGFLIGLLGFFIIYSLRYSQKIKMSPSMTILFSFTFSMGIAALWEILEFTIDSFFGTNMQRSGLVDTMLDMIVAGIGAIIFSFLGFIYLKYGKGTLIKNLILRMQRLNRKIRKNKKNKSI
jgi:hypothetical protein